MIFTKLFNRKERLRNRMIDRVSIFKENHKEDILFEEYIIDKKGEDICLIGTYDENSKLGIIHIFGYLKANERVIYIIEDDCIYISDIQIFKYKNRGIGSKVINILNEIGLQNNLSIMKGKIFSENNKHKEIQEYFYTKNGFTINGDKLERRIQKARLD